MALETLKPVRTCGEDLTAFFVFLGVLTQAVDVSESRSVR